MYTPPPPGDTMPIREVVELTTFEVNMQDVRVVLASSPCTAPPKTPAVLLVKLEEDTMNSPQELRDNDPSTIPR